MNWKLSAVALGTLLLAAPHSEAQTKRPGAESILKRFDANNDSYLQKSEMPAKIKAQFEKMDLNSDGKISLQELQKRFRPQFKGKGGPGEVNTPPARGERVQTSLKVGDAAPDFTLPTLTTEKTITLSKYRGKKPVVLIFGSYT